MERDEFKLRLSALERAQLDAWASRRRAQQKRAGKPYSVAGQAREALMALVVEDLSDDAPPEA